MESSNAGEERARASNAQKEQQSAAGGADGAPDTAVRPAGPEQLDLSWGLRAARTGEVIIPHSSEAGALREIRESPGDEVRRGAGRSQHAFIKECIIFYRDA